MVPKKILQKEIKRVKALVKGEDFVTNTPEIQSKIHMRLIWNEDDYPTVDRVEIKPYKKANALLKMMFTDENACELYFDFLVAFAQETKAYQKFNKRIKMACKISKELEEQYCDFDWYNDVLVPAAGY